MRSERATRLGVTALVAVAVLGMVLSCVSRRGVEPNAERKYNAYISMAENQAVVLVIDMHAEEIIDSLLLPQDWWGPLIVADSSKEGILTSRGRHVMRFSGNPLRLESDEFLTTVEHTFAGDLIVGNAGGSGCVVSPALVLYDRRDLSVAYEDTFSLAKPKFDAVHNRVIGLRYSCDAQGTLRTSDLGAYDLQARKPFKVWEIQSAPSAPKHWIGSYDLHPDGRRVYALAVDRDRQLMCFDLEREEIVFSIPMPDGGGRPQVTPDGTEVWMPVSGSSQFGPIHELIRIYSANDGTLLKTISLSDYRPLGIVQVNPYELRFVPTGEKAIVTCYSTSAGQVLIIDARTREITSALFMEERRIPLFLDVGLATE